jgi:hypothetical protein
VLEVVVLASLGDAAGYLDLSPSNVKARDEVLKEATSCLEHLHASGDYDRVVVVGHSLGSVIAYDAIKVAWQNLNRGRPIEEWRALPSLPAAERAAAAVRADVPPRPKVLLGWQEAVRAFWVEYRATGGTWLVTDFVSLGSPLAHGDFLLAASKARFREMLKRRTLPSAPPLLLDPDGTFTFVDGERQEEAIHHAAPFAMVRWTNLFFPASWMLHGDMVGGEVHKVFGGGVADVEVRTAAWRGWLAHTAYWLRDPRDGTGRGSPLPELRRALDLEGSTFPGGIVPRLRPPWP